VEVVRLNGNMSGFGRNGRFKAKDIQVSGYRAQSGDVDLMIGSSKGYPAGVTLLRDEAVALAKAILKEVE